MKKTLEEFKEFAVKGNAIDLAIGVVIGVAFGKVISSLVSDILTPPLSIIIGKVDFSNLKIILQEATETTDAVAINYGNLITVLFEFLIIAFVIFLVVKQINRIKKKEEKKTPGTAEDILLLKEIRDILKRS